jgi:hypothetical protein
MKAGQNIAAVGIATAAGAVLGLVQVTAAELTDITTLGASFEAGNERIQGVPVTRDGSAAGRRDHGRM